MSESVFRYGQDSEEVEYELNLILTGSCKELKGNLQRANRVASSVYYGSTKTNFQLQILLKEKVDTLQLKMQRRDFSNQGKAFRESK